LAGLDTFADIRRHSPTFADIRRHSPTFADIRRHSPTFADIRQPVLVRLDTFVDIRQTILLGLPRLAKGKFGNFYTNLANLASLVNLASVDGGASFVRQTKVRPDVSEHRRLSASTFVRPTLVRLRRLCARC
jgi:hypothetical protein